MQKHSLDGTGFPSRRFSATVKAFEPAMFEVGVVFCSLPPGAEVGNSLPDKLREIHSAGCGLAGVPNRYDRCGRGAEEKQKQNGRQTKTDHQSDSWNLVASSPRKSKQKIFDLPPRTQRKGTANFTTDDADLTDKRCSKVIAKSGHKIVQNIH
jgi:hypothetical protein